MRDARSAFLRLTRSEHLLRYLGGRDAAGVGDGQIHRLHELPRQFGPGGRWVLGILFLAIPLAAARNLRLTRGTLPLVIGMGLFEVIGFTCYTIGAHT